MPTDGLGQMITFATQVAPGQAYTRFVTVKARHGDTIKKIAARRGHPELVQKILKLNRGLRIEGHHRLRSASQTLRHGMVIRLPGTMRQGDVVSVHCGDERPIVKDGYALFSVVPRPGRMGVNRFDGYNPLAWDIAVQFEGWSEAFRPHNHPGGGDGVELEPRGGIIDPLHPPKSRPHQTAGQIIEDKIDKLRTMAGRGGAGVSAEGPPAVVRITVTDNHGRTVELVPTAAQRGGLYRITDIQWDPGALSDDRGRRIRATATVTVTQYTPINLVSPSAAQRARSRSSH